MGRAGLAFRSHAWTKPNGTPVSMSRMDSSSVDGIRLSGDIFLHGITFSDTMEMCLWSALHLFSGAAEATFLAQSFDTAQL
jgi:hypothetical protein